MKTALEIRREDSQSSLSIQNVFYLLRDVLENIQNLFGDLFQRNDNYNEVHKNSNKTSVK